jgi:hypothetical protein
LFDIYIVITMNQSAKIMIVSLEKKVYMLDLDSGELVHQFTDCDDINKYRIIDRQYIVNDDDEDIADEDTGSVKNLTQIFLKSLVHMKVELLE